MHLQHNKFTGSHYHSPMPLPFDCIRDHVMGTQIPSPLRWMYFQHNKFVRSHYRSCNLLVTPTPDSPVNYTNAYRQWLFLQVSRSSFLPPYMYTNPQRPDWTCRTGLLTPRCIGTQGLEGTRIDSLPYSA
ncbi:uncharacterized protein [Haliotis cracherodii]|uniref:uncharacterized protein n=1 Tax=Haliotis cracherodii TaxID=6455 RepID=UPI0039EB0D7A